MPGGAGALADGETVGQHAPRARSAARSRARPPGACARAWCVRRRGPAGALLAAGRALRGRALAPRLSLRGADLHGPALARAPATTPVAIGHGLRRPREIRRAASPSMLAPMLGFMSPPASHATPEEAGVPAGGPDAGAGIPDSALAGPFPVGEYASALR